MNNGTEEFAKLIKSLENPPAYRPVFGTIAALPELKIIRCDADKVILTKQHIQSLTDIYERDSDGNYIYLGKTAAMLPYSGDNKYLLLGVVQDG